MERNSVNSCLILLRHDQNPKDVGSYPNPDVTIYAPTWIKDGLEILSKNLQGCNNFRVVKGGFEDTTLTNVVIGSTLSLTELQKIARNEDRNTSGFINWRLYTTGGLKDEKVILGLKDLCRQTIIVGPDIATHYGGYPKTFPRIPIKPNEKVYVIDLAALQFQVEYNTGRLVLIKEKPKPSNEGLLDDFIFNHVVGEAKKLFQEAVQDQSGRYLKVQPSKEEGRRLFDLYAYKKFVSTDVVLTGLGVSKTAGYNGDKVNFKFLKYGTGFFAGPFRHVMDEYILDAVVDGMEILYEKYQNEVGKVIKHLEFPFYQNGRPQTLNRLERLKSLYGVTYSICKDDCMKPTQKGLVTATTNCGDSMAVFGNEMGFSSVDGAVTENLKSNGAIFCPILNPLIKEEFLEI